MMDQSGFSELGRRTGPPPISWLMQVALGRPQLISLAAGFTDNETLPVESVREVVSEILDSRGTGEYALQYGSTVGDPTLRDWTVRSLREADGQAEGAAPYDPERCLITHGSEQLLYIVTEALCDPGDIVLLEDPTYFVYLGALQSHGVRCHGIPLDAEGIQLEELRRRLDALVAEGAIHRLKMLGLVSYFQNPTGTTTSLDRKRAVLELLREYETAAGHPIYLLEDAVYRDLQFGGAPVPSALALTEHSDRVIYVGTYSKPFATGVRVGFGVLSEPLWTVVSRIKGNHDFGTSHFLQQVLVRAMESGRYAEHVERVRERYRQKAELMAATIREHFPKAVRWEPAQGGLYIWARLPETVDAGLDSSLFQTALENDLLYVPGELCYVDDAAREKPSHEMRLSFGAASESNIRDGIRRLGSVLAHFLD